MYKENIKIRYSDMDCGLVLKPSALLHFLENLASENAEELGFGYSYIVKRNLGWFLLKYRLEFENYPEGLYELDILTEPRGYNKYFAFRDFKIEHKGALVGRAATSWALVNIENKEMTSPADALEENPYMKLFEKREGDLSYSKIKPVTNPDIEKVFEVRFDDLDVNQHVNNSNYIVWAFEPMDFEFRKSYKLKNLDVVFKKEVKYGSKILSLVEKENNITRHALKNAENNEEFCVMQAEWCSKQ